MKKLFALILALAMVFAFAACGSTSDDDGSTKKPAEQTTGGKTPGGTDVGGSTPNVNFDDLLSGSTEVVWGKADAATKEEIKRQAAEEGMTVTFGADGSMTLKDENGTYTQHPDGTWTLKYNDGTGTIDIGGGKWPDNALTKLVPKPDFGVQMTNEEENGYGIYFSDATLEGLKAYSKKVASSGFDRNVETGEVGDVFYYRAANADGKHVSLTFAEGSGVMGIYHSDPLGGDDDDYGGDDDDDYGDDYEYGLDWPTNNALAALVPKPDTAVSGSIMSGNDLNIMCQPASSDVFYKYVQSVKAAGFNVDADVSEVELGDGITYVFGAYDGKGHSITIYSNEYTFTITLSNE